MRSLIRDGGASILMGFMARVGSMVGVLTWCGIKIFGIRLGVGRRYSHKVSLYSMWVTIYRGTSMGLPYKSKCQGKFAETCVAPLSCALRAFREGHEQEAKAQRAAQHTAAAARKQAKMMKPRKEDVSQLTD